MSASVTKFQEIETYRLNSSRIVWRSLSALPLRTPQKILVRLKPDGEPVPYRWLPYDDFAKRSQFGGRWQTLRTDGSNYFTDTPLPKGAGYEWCPNPTRKD